MSRLDENRARGTSEEAGSRENGTVRDGGCSKHRQVEHGEGMI